MMVENPEITGFCYRATKLYQHCNCVNSSGPAKFIQVSRDASVAKEPDSDDEQFVDPPIPKSFSDNEIILINCRFAALCDSFLMTKQKAFQNHAGKRFFSELGMYLMSVLPLPDSCYDTRMRSFYSTNPKGGAQPGACSLMMSYPTVHNTRAVK